MQSVTLIIFILNTFSTQTEFNFNFLPSYIAIHYSVEINYKNFVSYMFAIVIYFI